MLKITFLFFKGIILLKWFSECIFFMLCIHVEKKKMRQDDENVVLSLSKKLNIRQI